MQTYFDQFLCKFHIRLITNHNFVKIFINFMLKEKVSETPVLVLSTTINFKIIFLMRPTSLSNSFRMWLSVSVFMFLGKEFQNTSLVAKGALAHRLQRLTACKIQNGRQGAPKWLTGSGKVSTPRFLGVLSNFR